MKKIFAFLAIATMFAVACSKPADNKPADKPNDEQPDDQKPDDQKPDDQKPDDQKPGDDYAGPVEGSSEWSLIGALLDANWDKDYVAAKDGDIYVVKNVKLAASDQFKFRKDKDWAENRGATGDVEPFVVTTGTALEVVHNGKNLAVSADGIYDIYYNAAKEQMCIVAKDGTPTWAEGGDQPQPQPAGGIAIDGEFEDWVNLPAGTFKRAVTDPDSPWPGVAEIRCYADPATVYYYIKFDEESLQECKEAATPAMHLRLCINTDGEYESGYTSYFLEGYDFIVEGQIMDAGEFVDFDGTLHQRIGGWVTLLEPENGLVCGKGVGLEFEIALDRGLFNKAIDDAVAAGTIEAEDKKPMGDTFQTGIRFYYNGWDEFSNMPNSSIEEEQGDGYGYLMRITTNK